MSNGNVYYNKKVKPSLDDYLNSVSYAVNKQYIPSEFALRLTLFIKQVTDGKGEDNTTPIVHYRMLDTVVDNNPYCVSVCSRGLAKTTLLAEMIILYQAVYYKIEGLPFIPDVMLYISDSIDNGVKSMHDNLLARITNSEFLQKHLDMKRTKILAKIFTFYNIKGEETIVKAYGAKTGMRGTRAKNKRPSLAIIDDVLNDDDSKSVIEIENINNTIYKALNHALDPTGRKVLWIGTPFNMADPIVTAVESGTWSVNVYPICEKFPCSKEVFIGAWEERFNYEYVLEQYELAKSVNQLQAFYQELMLRVSPIEDKLVKYDNVWWFDKELVMKHKYNYNFYITTDLGVKDKAHNDPTCICVWAYSAKNHWLLVDIFMDRVLTNISVNKLFDMVIKYNPLQVGIEDSGQQGIFVTWLKTEMIARNWFFNIAEVKPSTDKLSRFLIMQPQIIGNKVGIYKQLENNAELYTEVILKQLLQVTKNKLPKHDDFLDCISQLLYLEPTTPSSGHSTMQDVADNELINFYEREYNSSNKESDRSIRYTVKED